MRFYWNLNGNILSRVLPGVQQTANIPLKGGQREPLELQFHNDGTPTRLAVGTVITFAIKEAGKFEGDNLTSTAAWTRPADASGFYTATLSTLTDPIKAALLLDGNAANDKAVLKSAIGELQYLLPGETVPTKSPTIFFDIGSWVIQGDEEIIDDADPPYPPSIEVGRIFTDVTGYTGGGGTKLDGIATAGVAFNVVAFVHATEGLRWYQLVAGTDAEASPGIIRPDDFDADTNARVWKSVL